MLFKPEVFEPLTDAGWEAERVRAAIRRIVADTDEALRGPKLLWRADKWDSWRATSPMKNLYAGAAGVLWALAELRRRGHAETRLDLGALALSNLERFRTRPDLFRDDAWPLPTPPESSLMHGEAGILLVAYALAPSPEVADDLLAHVHANVGNEAVELMWGSPGTLIAASFMRRWTGEERWRDACMETAEALWAARDEEGLWESQLYGQQFRSLNPPHGLVGNVQALRPHLDDVRRGRLERETAAVLARTAVVEDGLANWPSRIGRGLEGPDGEIRVQWCCGSPGMVIAAADYLDEELLLAGAELPWRTGPSSLAKGPGICHGTSGNGYAFLKTFKRTGDERWLERARRFAVHALEQVERLRRDRGGRGRYALWPGDLGVALYAADCLDERAVYPFFDAG